MAEKLTGWSLLHSPLPKEALHELPEQAFGFKGLTDIDDTFLLERLFESGMVFDFEKPDFTSERVKIKMKGDFVDGWSVTCILGITIHSPGSTSPDRTFWGRGSHEDHRRTVAEKGALTSAFKTCCKWLGMDKDVRRGKPGDDTLFTKPEPDPVVTEAATTLPPCPVDGWPLKVTKRKDNSGYFVSCTHWKPNGSDNCSFIDDYDPDTKTIGKSGGFKAAPKAPPVKLGPHQTKALELLRSGKIAKEDMAIAFVRASLPEKQTPAEIAGLSDEVAHVLVEALSDFVTTA